MRTHRFKSQTLLVVLALIVALIFCTLLTISGVSNLVSVLSGASDHNTHFTGFSLVRTLVNLAYIGLGILYLVWLLGRTVVAPTLPKLLQQSLPFLLIGFITYPYSTDVYLYLQYGLMGLQGINPYLNPASSFHSVLSPLVEWSQTSTYGPISQLFFMGTAGATLIHPVLGIYTFKLLCLLFHVLNACLLWMLLGDLRGRNKLTAAYLINPVLLNEQIANAHVDVFLCHCLLILIGCLYYRYYSAALLAVFAGFLTKTLPLIWVPLVVGFLIYRRRWRDLAIATLVGGSIALVLCYTVFPTPAAWSSLINPGVGDLTARSLHSLIDLSLSYLPGLSPEIKQSALTMAKLLGYCVFFVWYSWAMLRPYYKRQYTEADLILDIGWTTLVLFLFATPWLMPWYPTILLPIAFLSLHAPHFFLISLVFCFSPGLIHGTGSGRTLLSLITSLVSVGPVLVLLCLDHPCLQWLTEQVKIRLRLPSRAEI